MRANDFRWNNSCLLKFVAAWQKREQSSQGGECSIISYQKPLWNLTKHKGRPKAAIICPKFLSWISLSSKRTSPAHPKHHTSPPQRDSRAGWGVGATWRCPCSVLRGARSVLGNVDINLPPVQKDCKQIESKSWASCSSQRTSSKYLIETLSKRCSQLPFPLCNLSFICSWGML